MCVLCVKFILILLTVLHNSNFYLKQTPHLRYQGMSMIGSLSTLRYGFTVGIWAQMGSKGFSHTILTIIYWQG